LLDIRSRDRIAIPIPLGLPVNDALTKTGLDAAVPLRDTRQQFRLASNAAASELRQQETHRWLFFEPSFSSSATVAGNGDTRCTGPFAMSAVVCPLRATAVTSAPFDTRY